MRTNRLLLLAAAMAATLGLTPARADTVRVTVSFYSAATGPYFEKMAAEFTKANPGTDVKIQVVNWDGLLQKLRTDIAGGANSDISIIGTRWLLDFVRDDVAEPLDGYMDPAFKNRFIGPFLKPGEIDGKVYGLPIAASARAMFYNKDMLTKAGFPNGPATWDDVVAASAKIHEAGGNGFALMAKGTEVDVYYYYALWSYGGDVVGPDGKAAFASPAGVKAMELYKSMVDRGLTQDSPTNYTRADIQELFKQGRVGMLISLPFMINQIAKEVPNLQYGIVPVPKGTTVLHLRGDGFGGDVQKLQGEGVGLEVPRLPVHQGAAGRVHQGRGVPADHQGGSNRSLLHRQRAAEGVRGPAADRPFRPDRDRLGRHREGGDRRRAVGLSRQGAAGSRIEAGGGTGERVAGQVTRCARHARGRCSPPGC